MADFIIVVAGLAIFWVIVEWPRKPRRRRSDKSAKKLRMFDPDFFRRKKRERQRRYNGKF